MREFFIQNEYGQQIQLQWGNIFFWEPAGLGFEESIEYMEADGFFIETKKLPTQVEKTGTLVFWKDNAYQNYDQFMAWVLLAQRLTFAYKPVNDWYYIDVNISRVEKSELTEYGGLEVPIVFQPLTPWYSPYNLNLIATGDDPNEIKTYAYTYPYRYADNQRLGDLSFVLDSQIPSAFSLTLPGYIESPVITFSRQDTQETLGVIDLTDVTVETGETLVYNGVPTKAGVYLQTPSGNTDLISQIGLSAENPAFFYLPPQVPLKVSTVGTSTQTVSLYLTVYRYYRTV